jgi:ketosteroid isomerase-like protein
LDGTTGEVWTHERYVENLEGNPNPKLTIDELSIHVDHDTAVVSARTSRGERRFGRYVDTYRRDGDGWLCMHACVWPVADA